MKPGSRASRPAPGAEPAPQAVRVAYHQGPPEIHFAGLPWRRGVADAVSAEKWAEMQARGDFHHFDFRPVAAQQEPETPAKEQGD